jgi:hypothetical protein
MLALIRVRRLDAQLDDEVLAHLEMAERDAIAAGLSPEDARRAARRRFGGIERMKEEHRDRRSVRWVETLVKDFRYGLRQVRRDPGFACVAIGVMAIGIGANTAMFSLMDAVLLKPLPYPEPERMVRVREAPTNSLLFEVSALDPLAFTLAAVLMILVGLFAALVPASRASRVDPVTALRSEA